MAYETITVEVTDGIGLIRLNRPDARNALNQQMLGEICQALEEGEKSDKVRVFILTGSEKAFAAGADITEMADLGYIDVAGVDLFGDVARRFMAIRKPIVAAVAGYALGGAASLR